MGKILFSLYCVVVIFIWLNSISELLFSDKHGIVRFIGKILFAPFWIIGVFSEQGREYLFNFTKDAKF